MAKIKKNIHSFKKKSIENKIIYAQSTTTSFEIIYQCISLIFIVID